MRLLTSFELAGRTEEDLASLFRTASQALSRTERGSAERRNGLATLENIGRALVACDTVGRGPGL